MERLGHRSTERFAPDSASLLLPMFTTRVAERLHVKLGRANRGLGWLWSIYSPVRARQGPRHNQRRCINPLLRHAALAGSPRHSRVPGDSAEPGHRQRGAKSLQ